jgi:hypothetical protein
MHGEVRVTVIATGFDKASAADAPAPAVGMARPAAGVLPFRDRQSRPTPPPPAGFAKPVEPPPAKRPAAGPGAPPPEVSEMEIPTFIRRQMD